MLRRSLFRIGMVVALTGLAFGSLIAGAQDQPAKRGRKYKAPPATARIEVTILRDFNSKPIENAAVIFHPLVGERDNGNMELKTNEDGKTIIDVLPIGDTVRLQVIAHGFQTYGQDFKIDKPEMSIEIKMKRPGEQYSIYKSGEGRAADGGKSPDGDKAPDPAQDGTGAKQPDAQTSPAPAKPQPQ